MVGWLVVGRLFVVGCLWLFVGWLLVGCSLLVVGWLLDVVAVVGCLLLVFVVGCCCWLLLLVAAVGWLLVAVVGWLLVGCWFFAGWLLVFCWLVVARPIPLLTAWNSLEKKWSKPHLDSGETRVEGIQGSEHG